MQAEALHSTFKEIIREAKTNPTHKRRRDFYDPESAALADAAQEAIAAATEHPAGFIRRGVSFTIDVLVSVALSVLIAFVAFFSSELNSVIWALQVPQFGAVLPHLGELLGVFFGAWYSINTYLLFTRGQTIGQRLMGITVTGIDGL